MSDDLPPFKFRQWRLYANLSCQQLAERMGVTKNTVSRIERNQRGFSSNYLIDFTRAVGAPTCGAVLDMVPPGFDESAFRKQPRRPRGSEPDQIILRRAREIRKQLRLQKDAKKASTPTDNSDEQP